ncbi:hypothetical protein HAX54_052975, partial [Datura stramonium]|nr:hypothetical protein [Datura stramonium]
SCVIDEVLKEVRLPEKSSYCLEQYHCSDHGSSQVTAAARPKQCASQSLWLGWIDRYRCIVK